MTTSGGTRAAAAATSRQVKQRLVNLLFGQELRKTGPEGHRKLDYSIYKYDDLKKAYLERLHVLHPDKQRNFSSENGAHHQEQFQNHKQEFQQLQDVWSQYEEIAKSMMKVAGGDGEDANFTRFGVGCSFSDSDAEKALRSDITDQACRGWFSSGLLAQHSDTEEQYQQGTTSLSKNTSLIDEDLFVETAETSNGVDEVDLTRSSRMPRRTLIPGMK